MRGAICKMCFGGFYFLFSAVFSETIFIAFDKKHIVLVASVSEKVAGAVLAIVVKNVLVFIIQFIVQLV